MRERIRLPLVGACVALVLAVGCTSPSRELVGPEATVGTGTNAPAAADGTTLKATTPVNMSPAHGVTIDSLSTTLEIQNSTGQYVSASFTYLFEFYEGNNILNTYRVPQGAGGRTSVEVPDLKYGTLYRWRARPEFDGGIGTFSRTTDFSTPAPPPPPPPPPPPVPPTPPESRTPDPPPGQRLPLPFVLGLIEEVAAQYPGALRNSCQHEGGSWEFMDRVVDRLRLTDTRWGYNWKRGNVGDPSLDVIDYHFGPGPDEGSTDVYLIDIIVGHCSNDPRPGWTDVTASTAAGGTIGRWTGRGRF